MKNKKVLSLLLSLALVLGLALPSALAASTDIDNSDSGFSSDSVTEPAPDTSAEGEAPVEGKAPVIPEVPDEPEIPEAEKAAHIEGCSDDCTDEDCQCPCHELSLFERLMTCTSLDELFTIVDETPKEELLALTDEENARIEAKIAELEPEPLPPVEVEGTNDEPVESEIVYPTVNFTNVAPFGDPVVGGA